MRTFVVEPMHLREEVQAINRDQRDPGGNQPAAADALFDEDIERQRRRKPDEDPQPRHMQLPRDDQAGQRERDQVDQQRALVREQDRQRRDVVEQRRQRQRHLHQRRERVGRRGGPMLAQDEQEQDEEQRQEQL